MESSPLPQPNPIHHPPKKGDIREPSQPRDAGTDLSRLPTGTRKEEGRGLRAGPGSPAAPSCQSDSERLGAPARGAEGGAPPARLLGPPPRSAGRRRGPLPAACRPWRPMKPPAPPRGGQCGEPKALARTAFPQRPRPATRLWVGLSCPGLGRDPRPPGRLLPLSPGG